MTAPVSLAELRVWAEKQMPVQCEFPDDCETCGRGRAVLALLDIAEAAGEVHRISLRATEPWDRLGNALAKVRP